MGQNQVPNLDSPKLGGFPSKNAPSQLFRYPLFTQGIAFGCWGAEMPQPKKVPLYATTKIACTKQVQIQQEEHHSNQNKGLLKKQAHLKSKRISDERHHPKNEDTYCSPANSPHRLKGKAMGLSPPPPRPTPQNPRQNPTRKTATKHHNPPPPTNPTPPTTPTTPPNHERAATRRGTARCSARLRR